MDFCGSNVLSVLWANGTFVSFGGCIRVLGIFLVVVAVRVGGEIGGRF